jgi:THO complex subunit 7
MRWCNEDSANVQNQLTQQMQLSEFGILKSEISEQMIDLELKQYKKVSDNIAEKIERVKCEIDDSKKHLVTAKEIRRNKLEYSSLARLIKEQPDRREVIQKHEQLQAELVKQNEEFQKVNKSLENRRKDFACFMMLANELLKDAEILTDSPSGEDGVLLDDDDETNDLEGEEVVDVVENMIIE